MCVELCRLGACPHRRLWDRCYQQDKIPLAKLPLCVHDREAYNKLAHADATTEAEATRDFLPHEIERLRILRVEYLLGWKELPLRHS